LTIADNNLAQKIKAQTLVAQSADTSESLSKTLTLINMEKGQTLSKKRAFDFDFFLLSTK